MTLVKQLKVGPRNAQLLSIKNGLICLENKFQLLSKIIDNILFRLSKKRENLFMFWWKLFNWS